MKFNELSGQQSVRVTEDLFDEVAAALNRIFEDRERLSLTDSEVATIAIAVGLENNRQLGSSPPTKPFKLDSLDQDGVLRILIERKHPDADPDELRIHLDKYLEGGIQTLVDSINGGYITYRDYFRTK